MGENVAEHASLLSVNQGGPLTLETSQQGFMRYSRLCRIIAVGMPVTRHPPRRSGGMFGIRVYLVHGIYTDPEHTPI
jgi:hypothetical protein